MNEPLEAGYMVTCSHEVAEPIAELADNLHGGNMSKELTKYNRKLFVERAMPKPHHKFSEYQHCWWRRQMDARLRAEVPANAPLASSPRKRGPWAQARCAPPGFPAFAGLTCFTWRTS